MLKREIAAVAAVLADENNQDKTAEDIAAEMITVLDELRATTHRVAIVANYGWTGEQNTLAVLGPFSSRSPAATIKVGEGMAGTVQGGHGKWLRVPCYANVRAAWDAVRPDAESVREERLERMLGGVFRDNPTLFDPWTREGPQCCCGIRAGGWCHQHKKLNPAVIV